MFGGSSRGLPKGDASPALDRRHRRRFTALLNVAYDALVESDAIDEAFITDWKAKTCETVTIQAFHGGSARRRGR